jgi:hypothetical protein
MFHPSSGWPMLIVQCVADQTQFDRICTDRDSLN